MNDTPPEQLTREQIESMQLERLHELLSEVHDSNPFWTARMQQAEIAPGDVNSLDDFRKFPITVKAELVDDQNAHPP
ncbi:MAG: hypothetical protein DWQ34_10330 [Planctomycetota bacterium]|nr:MAG: hypothetical protein DWQ34_10330 [Planctomycetota bacterium]